MADEARPFETAVNMDDYFSYGQYYGLLKLAVLLIVFLATVISTWILGVRMRGRIKRDLGRKPKDEDLTSIETWMKVDEVEQKENPGRAWVPRSPDPQPDSDLVAPGKPIDLFAEPKDKTSQ